VYFYSIVSYYSTVLYVVQSKISWVGRIVTLLRATAHTRSHEVVPCPFFSLPSKKQLRSCGLFRKKVTVVKSSCLRAAEIENVTVWAKDKNVNFCLKLGKSASRTFQMIKQAYGEDAAGHSAVFIVAQKFCAGERQFGWWAYRSARYGQDWTQDPRSCNVGACQPLPNGEWTCSSSSSSSSRD
jgi:hypothetical protein